ncbi:MAG TPA: DUF1080 domain-containing protein [Chthoniobacteraceae bacterium]|jgi:hypothetical protein
MKRFLLLTLLALPLGAFAADAKDGWVPLFDGKSLEGWKANENPQTFSVKDGVLIVKGDRSHLFYNGPVQNHEFKNFEFKAEVQTKAKANSGIFIHTGFQESGWPSKGYEIQVNNTHGDPKKTAGVYGVKDNAEAPAKDDEWFTIHVKVEGKRIITKVNDKQIIDFTEPADLGNTTRKLSSGTFAIQGHDPGSEVHYRNISVKPLP